jgi:protein transport protein SEC20
VQQNLAAELREDIELISNQIESLRCLVPDQKGEKARQELRRITELQASDLAQLRKEYRAALLASKRTIDSLNAANRASLLYKNVPQQKQDASEKTAEDLVMKTSNDVTEALRRTIGLMQGELEKSVLSNQMLEASTASLKSTSSTHDVLTNVMDTSKQLITALEKSDWLDRLILASAMCFFFAVILFILKQRILDRGMKVAFWWTRFIPDFTGDDALLSMEQGSATSTNSLASTISSIVASFPPVVSTLASISGIEPAGSDTLNALSGISSLGEETSSDPTSSLSEVLESVFFTATTSTQLSPVETLSQPSASRLEDEL